MLAVTRHSEEMQEDLLAAAASMSERAGRAAPVRLLPLPGGKNNRVFAVTLADGGSLILKSYFSDPRDTRDRLGAEWAFLRYAWARNVRNVPEPLASEPARHLGLYARLPGVKLSAGGVRPEHVAAALDFVLAVNAPPRSAAAALPPASEACFSTAAHIATVDRRVRALTTLDAEAPMQAEAERFVNEVLTPTWKNVRARVEASASLTGIPLDEPLAPEATIVSPSDFGFHNALVKSGSVGFLDFEYAGRDDPAKLVCDFFCQPEVPVSQVYFADAVERIVGGLSLADAHRARFAVLLDLYRVKWTCIILNDFLPLGAARRSFADPGARAARCAAQLAKAADAMRAIDA